MFRFLMAVVCLAASVCLTPAIAEESVGKVAFASGQSWLVQGDKKVGIRLGQQMYASDVIFTGPRGRVKLMMNDGSKVYIGAKSKISLEKYSMDGKNLIEASFDMFWGKARFFVNKLVASKSSFQVRTSTAVLGVRGTEFLVMVPPTMQMLRGDFDRVAHASLPAMPTRMVLVHGVVEVGTDQGFSQRVTAGQTTDVDIRGQGSVRQTQESDLDSAERSEALAPVGVTDNASEEPAATGGSDMPVDESGEETGDPATEQEGAAAEESAVVEEPVVVEEVQPAIVEPTATQDVPTSVNTTVTNAMQSLGTTTDVNIQPSFVVP